MHAWRSRLTLLVALATVSLAGCLGGHGSDATDGTGSTGPGPSDTASVGSTGVTADPQARNGTFAVLVVEGVLHGEGPTPDRRVACSIAMPNGRVEVGSRQAWAKPGTHSFGADSWLVIADRVRVEDPRGACRLPLKATPFATVGEWKPQMEQPPMHLDVSDSGSDLLISKLPLASGATVEEHLEFQDGDYTFSGNLTFTHTGWWPRSAFTERDEDITPEADGAAWWG